MFETISPAPPDAILGLTDAFKADPTPGKINLGVGVYKDDRGATPVLSSVKKAEALLLDQEKTKSYLPISGSPGYARHVQELLFGADSALIRDRRVETAHTPGGTGGLRVGGDFLKLFRPDAKVWVSNPTWANHKGIFTASGFGIAEYPYYDPATQGLDFDAMAACLRKVPAGDIVLLHVCCHNPTGVDPSPAQWAELADIAATAGWMPFFDFAYQGFGSSVEADREPLGLFAAKGIEFLIAASFSKNFGLYNERTGSLSLVGTTTAAVEAAFSHVKTVVRTNYSNPSSHGGAIVETVLGNDSLREEWLRELDAMRDRIKTTRDAFVQGLRDAGVQRDFQFISTQNGMFSFSGLNDDQVAKLRANYGIYIVKGGRINVAGISSSNLAALCKAIAEVL